MTTARLLGNVGPWNSHSTGRRNPSTPFAMLWLLVSLGCWIGFVLLVGYVRRLRASEADPGGPTGDPLWPGPVAILLVLGALAGGIAALVGGLPVWGLVLAGASALLAAGMILWAVRDLAVEKS